MKNYLIPTRSVEHLGSRFEEKNDIDVLYIEDNDAGKAEFPNDEVYTKVDLPEDESVEEADYVSVLHSGQPYPDRGLGELNDVLYWLKSSDLEPGKVDLIFSHFPYQMQDAEFEEGEINKAERLVSQTLKIYGEKYVNPSSGEVLENDKGLPLEMSIVNPHFSLKDWLEKYEDSGL